MMKSTPDYHGWSLRRRLLLPFSLLLILIGATATIGSGLVIIETLSRDAAQRLLAIQEIVFREINQQEILLDTYADLLAYTRSVSLEKDIDPASRAVLEKHVATALNDANILLDYYPITILDIPTQPQRDLFDQALRSGRPRFRFVSAPGQPPNLTVVHTVSKGGTPQEFLALRTPINRSFLHQMTGPFVTRTYILSRDGKLLSASDEGSAAPLLLPEELARVLDGERLFKTVNMPLPHRQLFSAIPLGTTDLILLALDTPLTELDAVIGAMATRSVFTILAVLLFGGYIFFRLVNRVIMNPIDNLLTATEAISQGNLDYRIREISGGELGALANSFNAMIGEIEHLYQERLGHEKSLTLAQEEFRYKEILEAKNAEIEASNRELKTHLHEMATLFQLNQAMTSTLDLNLLFDRILKSLQDVIGCNEMVLLLYNSGAEELEVRKVLGLDPESLRGISFRLDEGITGQCASSLDVVYIRDLMSDSRNLNYKGRILRKGSMLSVPMVIKGRLTGVLNLHKDQTAAFSNSDIKLVQAVANQAAIAVENAQLYEKTRTLSNTDELTGLANRRHFQEISARELSQAQRFRSHFAIIMADIDHFKAFNDAHGHLRGDVVLKKVASIMLQNTRGIDLVGRFGGEEFVILLPKTTREGAMAAAEKLRQWVEQETFAGAQKSQPGGCLTLSLGVAEFPTDSKDLYELLDLADRALYRAKDAGRNRVVAWTPDA